MKTLFLSLIFAGAAFAQTSTDVFVMAGSDFVRPGLAPRVNLNVGVGHTFSCLKKNPFGDEITFAYTYENAGSHGFWHSNYGAHTEAIGLMKNFSIKGINSDKLTFYGWPQIGLTSITGGSNVQNRLYGGVGVGAAIHFTKNHAIWVQENFNKVVSFPWYTSTSIGYTYSR